LVRFEHPAPSFHGDWQSWLMHSPFKRDYPRMSNWLRFAIKAQAAVTCKLLLLLLLVIALDIPRAKMERTFNNYIYQFPHALIPPKTKKSISEFVKKF
jgi:hypothetical protein